MSFSKSLLGKELNELTIQDLKIYFQNPQQESNIVEYKSYNPNGDFEGKLKGVYKAVCALLNSEGGLVIWGAPKGKRVEGRKEEIFEGEITPLNRIIEKDNFINKLVSNITPLPNGITVNIIEGENSCICVLEVAKSQYSPHQTDNTYYMRLDGQSVPAPHHFIEALFKQIKYPNIEAYLKFDKASHDVISEVCTVNFTILIFNFSELQNEEKLTYRLMAYPGKFFSQYQKEEPFIITGHEELLHFGVPMMNSQLLIISNKELKASNYQLRLVLSFGGKKSPAKTSSYTLDLMKTDSSYPTNTTNLIIEKNENQLMAEVKRHLGTTRESTLQAVLGRAL
ncbi:AlbA family DNA-binding domain-containing protein [Adhaeribacter radiodurans]|uniref:ATP-binding protein n=1 Tax=Adhaeribacter radiodurans TaxID=2745197 RepID=A0A7L7L5N5_9BACT|nr:ATP-binding protein [Adhaeribacter radiodurans]QMU28116.1 ATP-binding protein [Adhaeribacter radiodurans]